MKIIRLIILYLILLLSDMSFAQGKISGNVTDVAGEPLIGASVLLEGTHIGAATDVNGYYFILNVPPGRYSVKASMIGYGSVVKKEVLVQSDLTTQLDFQLTEGTVEIEEVVITAERPLVQKDVTATVSIIGSRELEVMPITNFRDVIKYQSGFTDALHLRGGRSNQVGYMVDGLDVTNPLFGSYSPQEDRSSLLGQGSNQLFGDQYVSDPNASEYDGISLNKGSVQEVQVLTGTFNAEYGRAMAGVVNVVTKDPGSAYKFSLEYISPRINKSPYRERDAIAIDANPGPNDSLTYSAWDLRDHFDSWDTQMLGQLRGSFSGAVPLIPYLNFFASASAFNENSYLPFGYTIKRDYYEKIYFNPPGSDIKFSLTGIQGRNNWQPYVHDWKYLPQNFSRFERNSDHYYLQFTHVLSPRTFYTFKASILESRYSRYVPGLKLIINTDDYPSFEPIISDYIQPIRWSNEFFYRGHSPQIENSNSTTYELKADFSSQVGKAHLIKTGIDVITHDLKVFTYNNPWVGAVHDFQDYERNPVEAAVYVQDKIELDYLIFNIGLRLDYFSPNGPFLGSRTASGPFYPYDDTYATMFPDIYIPGFVDTSGEFQYYPEEKAPAQLYLSPRIGVSHPVTENLKFYFSYGHFVQRPDFREIFYTHDIQRSVALAGNPTAKIQKTISFEAGLTQAFGNKVAVGFSVYYRDIYDLLGSQFIAFFPYIYAVINNSDYANAKGFEISITKRYGNYFSANINYTFLRAQGNENEPRTTVQTYYGTTNNRLRPRRAFFLNWDRTHTFSGNINFWIPEDEGPEIFGIKPLSDFGANFLFQLKSGLPYTPTQRAEGDWSYWLRILQTNSERRPWTYQVDMDIYKNFHLGDIELSIFARIINLLNTDNVLYVYTNTGRLWDAGPTTSLSDDYLRDPNAKGPPRQIRFGITLKY